MLAATAEIPGEKHSHLYSVSLYSMNTSCTSFTSSMNSTNVRDEAVMVKQLVSVTCFIRITSVPAHLDKINIELNLQWEF